MSIVFVRGLVMFVVLFVVMRLMGKRQIGEMEPFELAITLVIAELVSDPVTEKDIPLSWGIIAVLTLFLIQRLFLILSSNHKLHTVVSGKPIMVVDNNGINFFELKKLKMCVTDLLQSLRVAGYFDIRAVKFALFETNGQISVVPKHSHINFETSFSLPLVVDGQISQLNLLDSNINMEKLNDFLKWKKLKVKNILLLAINSDKTLFLQEKYKKYQVLKNKEDFGVVSDD